MAALLCYHPHPFETNESLIMANDMLLHKQLCRI